MVPAPKSLVILIVEDDAVLRQLYRDAFMLEGYSVVAVEDGLDALRLLESAMSPTAMVLDLGLPRLGGRDVYHELKARAETRMIPVVIVTGEDTSDLAAGDVDCILKKPISVDAVVEAVNRCVRQSSRQGT